MGATLTELEGRGQGPFGEAAGLYAVAAPPKTGDGEALGSPPFAATRATFCMAPRGEGAAPWQELRPAHRSTIRWQRGRSS